MKITSDQTLKFIFTKDTQKIHFVIPDYQRNYVWESQQVEDYWIDLLNKKNLQFLGSFIFKESKGLDDKIIYEIVDGQQRIITTSLLLAALRDYCLEKSFDVLAKDIQEKMVHRSYYSGDENKEYILSCWDDVNPFFTTYILSGSEKISGAKIGKKEDTKINIKKNYELFQEKIKEYIGVDDKDIERKIRSILENIDEHKIVSIIVDTDEEAYTAFEIVNARGQELANIDLLKNLLIKEASRDNNKKYVLDKWREITENIVENTSQTKINLESFLKHSYISRFGRTNFITSKGLYSAIKEEVQNQGYEKVTEGIVSDSSLYFKFLSEDESLSLLKGVDSGSNRYNTEINKSLISLKDFNITQSYVLFLSLFRNQEKFSAKQIRNILKKVEIFHYAYSAVSKGQGNKVEKIYGRFAQEIEDVEPNNTQNINVIYDGIKNIFKDLMPLENEFIDNFISRINYKNKTLAYYSLSLYEDIVSNNRLGEKEINFNKTNIDHIYPQNLNKEFPINGLHSIGNLTLLNRVVNSSANDDLPINKISEYENSNCEMNKILAAKIKSQNEWSQKDIDLRSIEIARTIYGYINKELLS